MYDNRSYPVEYFNPHVHLEYDFNKNNLNEAEMKALQHEEYRNKNDKIKDIKNREYIQKYGQSAILFFEQEKERNKERIRNEYQTQKEKILKKQNFNRTVYENNMKQSSQRIIKSKSSNKFTQPKTTNKIIKVINHNDENIANIKNDVDFNIDNGSEKFVPKKRILKEINNINENDDNNVNNKIQIKGENVFLKNNMNENGFNNNNLNLRLDEKERINKKENIIADNNIVDLRGNIEEELLKIIKNKNKAKNDDELKDEINEKMSSIRRFRMHGILPEQNEKTKEKKKNKIVKKKFLSELDKKRYIKALKNILTERLGEHNIYIQNICNCGNLQNQLTALVEKGNLTVYALTEVECSNNCPFYKNKKAYLKNINDILNSIKDIAYENFHNKYK